MSQASIIQGCLFTDSIDIKGHMKHNMLMNFNRNLKFEYNCKQLQTNEIYHIIVYLNTLLHHIKNNFLIIQQYVEDMTLK